MYVYDQYDQKIVEDRVKQFRDQTRRYLAGELSGEEFRPLLLQNGLYIQRYAPMLRIAVPYGLLSSTQVRKLAEIARRYDKGYAHISTRTNVQFNWPELEDVPEILAELATVQMHAIQTSGNCIRNTTTDVFAGAADDEMSPLDPQLRVKGVTGLRVVDGSVMPQLVAVNPNITTMLIGERASDLIRGAQG